MKEVLKLDNQLCFQLYSSNRMMTRMYKPLLTPYGLTYPQYLVLLVLFESDCISVKTLGGRLYLDSGTLTPLLKRMEKQSLLTRQRDENDERKVIVCLTEAGKALEEELIQVPMALCQNYNVDMEEIIQLRETLKQLNQILIEE